MKPEKIDRRGTPKGMGTLVGVHGTTGLPGGQIGNPPHVVTDENRRLVRTLAKVLSQADIADELGVSPDTIQRHYAKEFRAGKREAVSAVGGKLLARALAGNMTAMIFYLRTQGKWNVRVEHTGADGGPVKLMDLSPHLAGMSDEQLRLLEPFLAAIVAEGGDGESSDDPLRLASGEGGAGETGDRADGA